jgi:hypothetical protein
MPRNQRTTSPTRAERERDACGIGFTAHVEGRASWGIVAAALEGLANVIHRGALDDGLRTAKTTSGGAATVFSYDLAEDMPLVISDGSGVPHHRPRRPALGTDGPHGQPDGVLPPRPDRDNPRLEGAVAAGWSAARHENLGLRELVMPVAGRSSTLPFVLPWISAAVGMDRLFGTLTIEHGSIVFEPTSKLNKVMTPSGIGRIVHTTQDVSSCAPSCCLPT